MDIKIKLKKLENFCNYLLEGINDLTRAHNTCMGSIEKYINDTDNKINNLENRIKHLEEYLESNYNKLNENLTCLEDKIKHIEDNLSTVDGININQYNELVELKDKIKSIEDNANSAYDTINYNFEVDGKDIKRLSDTVEIIDTELSMLKDNVKGLQEKING